VIDREARTGAATAGALLLALPALDRWNLGPWEFHPLSLLFIASGSMMISKTLRIPKP
jgi:hypothetical protein